MHGRAFMPRARFKAFNGVMYRSATEAVYASIFSELGLSYVYEKESFYLPGLGIYWPDFFIEGINVWVEIKGAPPTDRELELCSALACKTEQDVVLFCGRPKMMLSKRLVHEPLGFNTHIVCEDGGMGLVSGHHNWIHLLYKLKLIDPKKTTSEELERLQLAMLKGISNVEIDSFINGAELMTALLNDVAGWHPLTKRVAA